MSGRRSSSAAVRTAPVTTGAAHEDTLRALWVQFAAVLVVLAALWSWLAFGPLGEAERRALAPGLLRALTAQHLGLALASAAVVLVITVPLSLALTRGPLRGLRRPVVVAVGIGEGAPAIGLVVLVACVLGPGTVSAVTGLVACAVLPVLRVLVTGQQGAGAPGSRGGCGPGAGPSVSSPGNALVPALLLVEAVRTALVVTVGAAVLAAFTGGGGLGVLIITGVEHHQGTVVVVGAGLVTLLAVVADWLGRFGEALVRRRRQGADQET